MKKELLIPVLILGLMVAFAVVSLLVFLNGGRSERLVRWKLKLVLFLLTFNSMIWGAKAQDEEIELAPILYGPPPSKPQFFAMEAGIGSSIAEKPLFNKFTRESFQDEILSGISYHTTGYYILPFAQKDDVFHFLEFGIKYYNARMDFKKDIFYTLDYIDPVRDTNGYFYKVSGIAEHSYSTIDLSVKYNWGIEGKIYCAFGLSAGYVIENTFREKAAYSPSLANTVRFRDGLQPLRYENTYTAVMSEATPQESNNIVFKINLRIFYPIMIDDNYFVSPYIEAERILTNVRGNSDWGIIDISGGINFIFEI